MVWRTHVQQRWMAVRCVGGQVSRAISVSLPALQWHAIPQSCVLSECFQARAHGMFNTHGHGAAHVGKGGAYRCGGWCRRRRCQELSMHVVQPAWRQLLTSHTVTVCWGRTRLTIWAFLLLVSAPCHLCWCCCWCCCGSYSMIDLPSFLLKGCF